MPPQSRHRHALVTGLMLVSASVLTACASGKSSASVETMQVSSGRCGDAWRASSGGAVTLTMTNAENAALNVYLRNVQTGRVYLEVEGFGASATVTEHARLANGDYQLVCAGLDTGPVPGQTVHVTDGAAPSEADPGIVPVTFNDLLPISIEYKNWIISRLPALRAQVEALAVAAREGSTPAAKADWLTAHLTYETLGAAYDAFGDLDSGINGTPTPGTPPTTDPHLTGFHKVEALLWSGASASRLKPAIDELAASVSKLASEFPAKQIDPNQIALRAHEIIENAIQFELNGTTDAGSHSNLATVSANIAGAQKALGLIVPLLQTRYPDLAKTQAALTSAASTVAAFDHGGTWTPLDSLSRAQREDVNAALDNAAELLAPVAAICDERLPGSQ